MHLSSYVSSMAYFLLKLSRGALKNDDSDYQVDCLILIMGQESSWSLLSITFASTVTSSTATDHLAQRAQSHGVAVVALSLVTLFKWTMGMMVRRTRATFIPSFSDPHIFSAGKEYYVMTTVLRIILSEWKKDLIFSEFHLQADTSTVSSRGCFIRQSLLGKWSLWQNHGHEHAAVALLL